jgi:hypothetical protein
MTNLTFIETIGRKKFRMDDTSDEAPMIEMQFFNEFAELPYDKRRKAAAVGLKAAVMELIKSDGNV